MKPRVRSYLHCRLPVVLYYLRATVVNSHISIKLEHSLILVESDLRVELLNDNLSVLFPEAEVGVLPGSDCYELMGGDAPACRVIASKYKFSVRLSISKPDPILRKEPVWEEGYVK